MSIPGHLKAPIPLSTTYRVTPHTPIENVRFFEKISPRSFVDCVIACCLGQLHYRCGSVSISSCKPCRCRENSAWNIRERVYVCALHIEPFFFYWAASSTTSVSCRVLFLACYGMYICVRYASTASKTDPRMQRQAQPLEKCTLASGTSYVHGISMGSRSRCGEGYR